MGWEIHNFSKKSSWWKIDNYNKYYNVKIITTKRIVEIVHLKIPQEESFVPSLNCPKITQSNFTKSNYYKFSQKLHKSFSQNSNKILSHKSVITHHIYTLEKVAD